MPFPVAAAAALGGSALTSAMAYFNANKQMQFQERMSSTAHQREVEDLRKAGLNPILSAKLGGSSTPPGAMAQTPDFGSAFQAASNIMLQQAQARDLNASAKQKENANFVFSQTEAEQIRQVLSNLYETRSRANLNEAQKANLETSIRKIEAELKLFELDRQHSAFDLSRARQEASFYDSFGGKVAPWIDHILKGLPTPGIRINNFRR